MITPCLVALYLSQLIVFAGYGRATLQATRRPVPLALTVVLTGLMLFGLEVVISQQPYFWSGVAGADVRIGLLALDTERAQQVDGGGADRAHNHADRERRLVVQRASRGRRGIQRMLDHVRVVVRAGQQWGELPDGLRELADRSRKRGGDVGGSLTRGAGGAAQHPGAACRWMCGAAWV